MAKKNKKEKPVRADDFNIVLRPEEKILHTAHPGHPAEVFFFVPAFICFLGAPALIFTTVWAYIKEYIPGGNTAVTFAAILVALGIGLIIYRFIIMGRFYIVTNQRLIVTKGRARKSQMFLNLEDVYGISINQNFLYRLFHLADIDFQSPASPPRTRSFLILSFTSTIFKFNFLSREDGVETYRLLEQLIAHREK